jgi:hypothetical protein
MRELAPPGWNAAFPRAINNRGQIVGETMLPEVQHRCHLRAHGPPILGSFYQFRRPPSDMRET